MDADFQSEKNRYFVCLERAISKHKCHQCDLEAQNRKEAGQWHKVSSTVSRKRCQPPFAVQSRNEETKCMGSFWQLEMGKHLNCFLHLSHHLPKKENLECEASGETKQLTFGSWSSRSGSNSSIKPSQIFKAAQLFPPLSKIPEYSPNLPGLGCVKVTWLSQTFPDSLI